jgi:hypothetical protein
MELLLLTIPIILFFALMMYVLVRGIYQVSYGMKTGQRKVVREGIVVLSLLAAAVVLLVYFAIHLWQKHDLQFL